MDSHQSVVPAELNGLDPRYEIKQMLDRGGMSVVFKARDKVLDRYVAIKTIKTPRLEHKQLVAFQTEAKAIAALQHERILRVLDFGVMKNGNPYLVLDFLDGSTLYHHIKQNGPLGLEDAIPVVAQICEAMSHAHGHGIVHRDLKPTNIMLTRSLSAKVFDFGIAVVMENPERGVTLTPCGSIIGSPAYMSPEQIMQKRLDARTDIYSLGCVLFEAITSRPVFSSQSPLEVMRRHLHCAPPVVTNAYCRPDMLPKLNAIIQTALQKCPDNRYQSMDEFMDDLYDLLDDIDRSSLTRMRTEPAQVDCFEPRQSLKESQIIRLESARDRQNGFVTVAFCLSVLLTACTTLQAITLKEWDTISSLFSTGQSKNNKVSRSACEEMSYLIVNSADEAWRRVDIHELTIDLNKLPSDSTSLTLSHCDLSKVDLTPLARLKELKVLRLFECNLPASSLKTISAISTLQYIDIGKNIGLTQGDFEDLQKLRLKRLNLEHACLTDAHIKTICKIKTLTYLKIDWNSCLTSASVVEIANGLPDLEILDLGGTPIKANELLPLLKLKNLKTLKIDFMHYGDKDLDAISQFTNLEGLALGYSDITSKGLMHLIPRMKNLKTLKICGIDLPPRDIAEIQRRFPRLELVDELQL